MLLLWTRKRKTNYRQKLIDCVFDVTCFEANIIYWNYTQNYIKYNIWIEVISFEKLLEIKSQIDSNLIFQKSLQNGLNRLWKIVHHIMNIKQVVVNLTWYQIKRSKMFNSNGLKMEIKYRFFQWKLNMPWS